VKALFTILKNPSFRLEDIPDYKELLKPFGNALPYFPPQKASTPSGPVYFIPPECAISYRMATEKVPLLFVFFFFFVPLSISDLVLFCGLLPSFFFFLLQLSARVSCSRFLIES